MTDERRKFRPATKHEGARHLLNVWYTDRREHGHERYRAVKGVSVMLPGKSAERPWKTAHQQKGELTAAGTETRTPPKSGGIRQPLDIDAAGGFELDPDVVFAQKAMLALINVSPDYFEVLEMFAAGMSLEVIGKEYGCGEWRASQYLEAGLGVLHAYQILKPW